MNLTLAAIGPFWLILETVNPQRLSHQVTMVVLRMKRTLGRDWVGICRRYSLDAVYAEGTH